MIRLHVVAEGQTEETFVNNTLVEHFAPFGVSADVRCVRTSRKQGRIHRGGVLSYRQIKGDLEQWMKQDDHVNVWYSTMIDLYALPSEFPSFTAFQQIQDPLRRVRNLERVFRIDIGHRRFIPYIQLHEFEALLLAEPQRLLDEFPGQVSAVNRLRSSIARFDSPEHVDDGQQTAPSKRIIEQIPEYKGRKASAGPAIAASIGVATLRHKCAHFGQWIRWIEYLGRCAIKRAGSSDASAQ